MSIDPVLRYSNEECEKLFAELFPRGWTAGDVVDELAPQTWQQSPLVLVFHPTPEQIHEETVRMHENAQQLMRGRKETADDTLHTDDARASSRRTQADADRTG